MNYKIHLLTIVLFCINFSFSQNVRIHGNIIDDNYAAIILSPAVYSKLVDSKTEFNPKRGAFEFNISVSAPCFYRLYYKEKRVSIYVEPGTSIQLSLDNTKTEDYITFYSNFISENTILNQKNLPTIGTKEQREKLKSIAAQGKEEYFKAIENEMKIQEEAFLKIAEDANLSRDFIDLYTRNNIEMAGLLYKCYYPRFAFGSADSFIVKNPDFLDIYKSLPKGNNGYSQVVLYYENEMNYLKSKANQKFADEILSKKVDDLTLYKSYIQEANTYPNEILREYLIENLIGEWISFYGRTTDLKEQIVDFVEKLTDPKKRDLVKRKLVNLAQYETGKPAPIFSFEDNSGNIRNLKEFVGKIVYIDAWASWCAPCIAELPYSKEVYNRYKGNPDIVFLYISIDDNKENWEKMLRERKLYDEIQGIAFPNGFNSDFARKYSIQGIPNYILIDKSGNLITHRAPKPSQPEKLYPLLDKLLGVK